MSKITNRETEASVSCGFYNSDGVSGTRKYDAEQMSAIFDGLIHDGIFASIGTAFNVTASSGNTVNVGAGKCWFNHTWTLNDAPLPINCGDGEYEAERGAHSYLNRIDAIVIEVDAREHVRDNFIKFVKGAEAETPVRPTMIREDKLNQYTLCYIYRKAGSTEIKPEDITNAIGVETPFVTGILEYVKPEDFCKQWLAQVNNLVKDTEADLEAYKVEKSEDIDKYIADQESAFNTWYSDMKTLMADVINETTTWTENQKASVLDWFNGMKNQLSTDAAINLQIQIKRAEIERILLVGLLDGEKTISDDGSVITTIDSKGRKLVKTFTNNFLTITTVLTDANDVVMGEMIKNLSSDGDIINTEVTIHEIEIEIDPGTGGGGASYNVRIEDDVLILS